jgi:hypothetical protein
VGPDGEEQNGFGFILQDKIEDNAAIGPGAGRPGALEFFFEFVGA